MQRAEHKKDPTLSVVVPVYNEEAVLTEFHARLSAVLDGLDLPAEVVYVNDGSSDASLALLRTLSCPCGSLAVVDLSRNFGKEAAMSAGLDQARGEAVVLMDADLQDPPELIPELLRRWREGHDVVYARRRRREGDTALKRATAFGFYRVMDRLCDIPIPRDTGDYRLLSARAVRAVRRLGERHRFMKGLFAWIGYSQVGVDYEREPRHAGSTKFNYWKLWNFALEGITSFSVVPLRAATYLGLVIALLAFGFAGWIVLKTLLFGEPVRGYPTIMTTMLLLGGMQLMAIGLVGEYLGRVFNETKGRPLYLVNALYTDARPLASAQADPPVLPLAPDAQAAGPGGPGHPARRGV